MSFNGTFECQEFQVDALLTDQHFTYDLQAKKHKKSGKLMLEDRRQ